ncbi:MULTISPECIES: S49 family peptidase [Rhodomicrobium]|uniref:S49 family peptidase n=1 Tax=Rhodomicrobium TaxID=1068 RepID=UPI000B4C11F1|nr:MULTISPECIES: S49 family peptidase [Rhodomicrobium]
MINPITRLKRLFKRGPVVPVVRLTGVIGAGTPLRQGLSLANVATTLDRAFALADDAIAIQVNSPGGSPVQSRQIFQRIRDLAREKNVRVYMFAEDVAASGGYMILCAGDEIYADSSSIVGSIGVIFAGFGFVDLINKIGVERRVHTSGEKKMALDSFQPENPDDVIRLKALQADIHEDFIALVRERRGDRIAAAGDQLFTGEFWAGRRALELGLVDGLNDVRTKMRERYGKSVRLRLVSSERGLFRRRSPGVLSALNASMAGFSAGGLAEEAISAIEARAIWARFGF